MVIQNGRMLALNSSTRRFIDGHVIPGDVWQFSKPDHRLIRTPDDRLTVCISKPSSGKATFYEVQVTALGPLRLRPHLALVAIATRGRPAPGHASPGALVFHWHAVRLGRQGIHRSTQPMPSLSIGRLWPAKGIPAIMSALSRCWLGLIADGVFGMDKRSLMGLR